MYGNAYNYMGMEKELWRINRIDRNHSLIPNVSFEFQYKNGLMDSIFVKCQNKGGISAFNNEIGLLHIETGTKFLKPTLSKSKIHCQLSLILSCAH